MKNDLTALNRACEIIAKGKTGSILLPTNPSYDAVAASTSLYLALTKIGKTITLACESKVDVDLTGVDKIENNLITGGDNLVISFPYTDGSIDKVDYNIKGNFFNLIITPRPGHPKLDPSQVKYSYSGGTVDFFITIDTPNLNSLGSLYLENQNQFTGCDIINIDRHLTNNFFGTVNLVNKTSSSVSELVFSIIKNLNVELDRNIATNLYAGITNATNNFTSYSVNADTLENAAQLLRAGAAKKVFKKPQIKLPANQPNKEIYTVKPIEEVEKESQPEQSAPQDWLKPKIFRGSNLI
ncbi:MAG: DHH family phosphoesterase [Microgenomates group bacterium]